MLEIFDPISSRGHKAFNSKLIRCLETPYQIRILAPRAIDSSVSGLDTGAEWLFKFDGFAMSLLRHVCCILLGGRRKGKLILSIENRFIFLFLLLPLSFRKRYFIVIHNNVRGYENANRIVQWFFQRALAGVNAIFLTHRAQKSMKSFRFNSTLKSRIPIQMNKPLCVKDEPIAQYIYWPAKSNSDLEFIYSLQSSKKLNRFLESKSITVIYHDPKCGVDVSPQWKCVKGRLEYQTYIDLLSQSRMVVVRYASSYVGRASSVIVDCVENGANFYLSDTEENREYEELIGNDRFFQTEDDFFALMIRAFDAEQINISRKCISSLEFQRSADLNGFFSRVLHEDR